MKQFISKILIASLVLGGGAIAYAEETSADATANVQTETKPATFIQTLKARLQGVKDVRVQTKTDIKNVRSEAKDKIKETREGMASTTEGTRKEIKTEKREKMEEKKSEMAEKRAEKAKEKIENRFEKMNARFRATIERIENIMVRVNARIEKIKNAGGNTAAAEKLAAEAKMHLDLAKASLIKLKETADTTVSLETSLETKTKAKASLISLKTIAKELETHLRESHVMLEKAVGSLKGLSQIKPAETKTETP
ncbi:MAG: hypothetical protein HY507_01810 [Candidatus Zambryskibacteria bacterium]|nr:hypothetical protein [Candidatus Zambryskibacteria bacterium]